MVNVSSLGVSRRARAVSALAPEAPRAPPRLPPSGLFERIYRLPGRRSIARSRSEQRAPRRREKQLLQLLLGARLEDGQHLVAAAQLGRADRDLGLALAQHRDEAGVR